LEEAKKHLEYAIKLKPDYAEAYNNLGVLYNDLEELEKAKEFLEYAIKLKPDYAEAYNNISTIYLNLDQLEKAKINLEQAIKIKPNFALAYATFGLLYLKQDEPDIAKKYFEQGINLKSASGINYLCLGTYYENIQEYKKAEVFYNKAIFLKENKAKIALANLLANTGRHKEADEIYEDIIKYNQHNAEIYFNKAINFFSDGKVYLAIKNLKSSKKINPNLYDKKQERLYSVLYFKNMICDWDDYEENINKLIKNLKFNYVNGANPYIFLTFYDSLELIYKIVKIKSDLHKVIDKKIYINIKKNKTKKINIGYYSSDFKDHPVGNIVSELIKAHDKERFCISGFNLKNNLYRDKVTDKIINSLDKYIDLEKKDYKNLINSSKKEKIDIAVDLVGFTAYGNQKAFIERLAPIQINFLGYPGTLGSSHDYIIADKNTIPYKHKSFYFEKIIYMPNFFLPTFTKFNINENLDNNFFNLKENIKTVFCNFSSFHKISPIIFDTWMKILKNSEDSVLWLLNADEIIQNNLKKEAHKKNININRIIFSKRLDFNEHTTKYKFCDLYLDTFPYNSHSTSAGCLFSGTPLLTIEGEGFQSRVASSLLKNLGLNELICSNEQEYMEKAINFGNSPTELKIVKEKLRKSLALNYKIFDMKNYVKNLEEAYLKIYEINSNNLKPTDILIN
jgi:predicted O-linked N-acetylglucosamine transferase (SPINDLY family)